MDAMDLPVGGAIVLHLVQGNAELHVAIANLEVVHSRTEVNMAHMNRGVVEIFPLDRTRIDLEVCFGRPGR